MNIINKKIKELYNNDKTLLSETIDVPYKNLASKIRTVENKIDFVNEFLKPLNLSVEIIEVGKKIEEKDLQNDI